LTKQLEELKDALTLAHEALRREMPWAATYGWHWL
jgi:hypothetical protein